MPTGRWITWHCHAATPLYAHVEVIDDVLRRQRVDEANGGREGRIEGQMLPDVEQEPRLG